MLARMLAGPPPAWMHAVALPETAAGFRVYRGGG
jgi:hypothetical protein